MTVRAALADLADALLPARCPGCGDRGRPLCAPCSAALTEAPRYDPPAGVQWWTACFAYEGVARELIARAKYRDERNALLFAVPHVVAALSRTPAPIDIVTWIPASRTRRRAHGIDHGEVLARAVARQMGLRVQPFFVRAGGTAQTGRDAQSRRRGPDLRLIAAPGPATVLVIDDVATTGGSLATAARALRTGGARSVFAATLARTRRPGDGVRGAAYTFPTAAEPRMA